MLSIEVSGDRELIAKITAMPSKLHDALLRKSTALTLMLEAKVKAKLSGPVLNVRSGNLRASIFSEIINEPSRVGGKVASSGDVKYAAIHEFGGTTPPHDIYPVKGKALAFMMGGKQVFFAHVRHPGSVIPERSYLRSSLAEMRQEIIDGLNEAVRQGLHE